MNETEKRSFYESYSNSCHWIGRIGLAVGMVIIITDQMGSGRNQCI